METVLVTGISGSGVADFVDETVKLGNDLGNKVWEHVRFAQLMYDCDPERRRLTYERWEDSILKRCAALRHLRDRAFDSLLGRAEQIRNDETEDQPHVLLVSTHATFWYRKTLVPGLDLGRIAELDPDGFVTIVDDVLDVWKRLLNTGQDRWKELSPVDILEWREIETFVTEQMALHSGQKYSAKPFYVIARRFEPHCLQRILSQPSLSRYYRSYPITFVNQRPEVKQEADALARSVREIVVLFDPMGILDLERQDELKSEYEAWCTQHDLAAADADWLAIKQHLRYQTVSRDHRLIDQSDGVIVYYPELEYFTKTNGDYLLTPLVPFSSGVLDEMQYATQRGKRVLLVWTSRRDPGPFLSNIYTRRFASIEEAVTFLKQHPERLKAELE